MKTKKDDSSKIVKSKTVPNKPKIAKSSRSSKAPSRSVNLSINSDIEKFVQKVTDKIVTAIVKKVTKEVISQVTKAAVEQVVSKVSKAAVEKVSSKVSKAAVERAVNKSSNAKPNKEKQTNVKFIKNTETSNYNKNKLPKNNEEVIRINTFFKGNPGKKELEMNADKILHLIKRNKLILNSLCSIMPPKIHKSKNPSILENPLNEDSSNIGSIPKVIVLQVDDSPELIFELWIKKSPDNEIMTKIYDNVQNIFYKAIEKKLCSDFAFLI